MNAPTHFDRIVIGGGAMGLATTWQLASRGARVLLLEQFERGHTRGASHGATRNMNNAYTQDFYLDLYDEALELWRDLEAQTGRQLLTLQGIVTHGRSPAVRASYEALVARGGSAELVTPEEAETRWPGMRFEGDVLVNRDAGRIQSANALEVFDELARGLGAELRYEHCVVELTEHSDGVTVVAESLAGERKHFTADAVVVTAGAWTAGLFEGIADGAAITTGAAKGTEDTGRGDASTSGISASATEAAAPTSSALALPPLRITEEHPAHFAILPQYESTNWPSFNHFAPLDRTRGFGGNIYGMFTPGEGVKVGFHATGDEVDPDARRFRASDEARAQLREYVAEWFPGLDPDSAVEISCTYTTTPSERFVLDTRGRITVGAGFSGHGFKFVPAIGRVLADASLDNAQPPREFLLESHLADGR